MTAPAPTLSATRRPHIVWLDVMRLVAILMVVICHCTDPLNASAEARSNPDIGFWGAVWGSRGPCLRPAVRNDHRSAAATGPPRGRSLL